MTTLLKRAWHSSTSTKVAALSASLFSTAVAVASMKEMRRQRATRIDGTSTSPSPSTQEKHQLTLPVDEDVDSDTNSIYTLTCGSLAPVIENVPIRSLSLTQPHKAIVTGAGVMFLQGTGTSGQLGDVYLSMYMHVMNKVKNVVPSVLERFMTFTHFTRPSGIDTKAAQVLCGPDYTLFRDDEGRVHGFGEGLRTYAHFESDDTHKPTSWHDKALHTLPIPYAVPRRLALPEDEDRIVDMCHVFEKNLAVFLSGTHRLHPSSLFQPVPADKGSVYTLNPLHPNAAMHTIPHPHSSVFSSISCGRSRFSALTSSGAVFDLNGDEDELPHAFEFAEVERNWRGDEKMVFSSRDLCAVAAGKVHTLGLLRSGKVVAWGEKYKGKLGLGFTDYYKDSAAFFEKQRVTQPSLVKGSLEDKTVTKIAASDEYSCAVTDQGELYVWGDLSALGFPSIYLEPHKVPLKGRVVDVVPEPTRLNLVFENKKGPHVPLLFRIG